jgi:hypothetical protein
METSGEIEQEALGIVGTTARSIKGRHGCNIRKSSLRNQHHPQK